MAKSSKGPAYERSMCRVFSLWWTGNKEDVYFWRTASSGGRATNRMRKGKTTKNQNGDICATCPEAMLFLDMFTIEIKRGYSRDTVMDLMDCSIHFAMQVYEDWFRQAIRSQKAASSYSWMLISKRDKRIPLMLLPLETVNALERVGCKGLSEKHYSVFNIPIRDEDMQKVWSSVVCFPLQYWFDCVTPDHIKTLHKETTDGSSKRKNVREKKAKVRQS